MLRNDASNSRAQRSTSGAVQRLNVAALRRRRLADALAVATTVAAFIGGSIGGNVGDSNVYAQQSQTSRGAQANAQRGGAAAKTPLFSGKFARNVSEKFSRGDATANQTAPRRSSATAATNERATNARPNPGNAPGASAAARVPATQRPQRSFVAPNRSSAPSYNASNPGASRASSADALAQPSTSRESAQEALAKVPWNALSPAARDKLAALAKNPTIYRRLPMAGGYCNPELFDFFLTHPHAVVGLWRQMGYDDVAMAPIGQNLYSVREKTGTVGRAQILYQDNELTLVYCSGKYQGPVVPRSLDGEMFLVLQTRYTEDPTGRPIVVCRLDAFVDLKNPGADLLARTFSGALGKLADSNFEQTLAFIDNVSQTAETNPAALSGSIAGLSELSPEARRLFAAKTSEIARQAQLRARGTYVDYQLLPKLNAPAPTVARVLSRERTGNADAALAARSRFATSPTSAPLADFNVDATPDRAGSAFARSPLSQAPSSFNDFDEPSLAQNSFALSDDAETDYDFESELDWEDEAPLKVGGARVAPRPLAAPALVPETSVAKATARPSTRFSDALALVDANANANADETDVYSGTLLADDEPTTLATDDETDDATLEDGLPLLLDFENELLEEGAPTLAETELNDVASPVGKPAPLAALTTPNAADAVALPGLLSDAETADANAEPNEVATDLPVLVFDDATLAETPAASSVAQPAAPSSDEDVPLLLLPDPGTADAAPTLATPEKTASSAIPKVAFKNDLTPTSPRGRVAAPIVPNTKKPAPAKSTKTTGLAKPANSANTEKQEKSTLPQQPQAVPNAQTPAPVWRAVEPKPAQAKVAPPIAETARAETEKSGKGGATFRKPEIH